MFVLSELNPHNFKTTPQVDANLLILLDKINIIRTVYGIPMIVDSGYRSIEDHLRIYREKGITDKTKIPMKSKHLYGQAVDIADHEGKLMLWCKANTQELERAGLWCEDGTHGWVHFQIIPPSSGHRFFLP